MLKPLHCIGQKISTKFKLRAVFIWIYFTYLRNRDPFSINCIYWFSVILIDLKKMAFFASELTSLFGKHVRRNFFELFVSIALMSKNEMFIVGEMNDFSILDHIFSRSRWTSCFRIARCGSKYRFEKCPPIPFFKV